MLLRSHGGGNCSGDGGAHEGGPDLHPTGFNTVFLFLIIYQAFSCRPSYMRAHTLLNLFNELEKSDKMRCLPSIVSLFRNECNKFNYTRAQMLDSLCHI